MTHKVQKSLLHTPFHCLRSKRDEPGKYFFQVNAETNRKQHRTIAQNNRVMNMKQLETSTQMLDKAIDLSSLRMMADNDEEFMIDILETFNSSADESVYNMQAALCHGDMPGLKAEAHKFKSSVSILGNETVTQYLQVIEALAEDGQDQQQLRHYVKLVSMISLAMVRQVVEALGDLRKNAA